MSAPLQTADAPKWSQWVTDFDKTLVNFKNTYGGLANLKSWVAAHPQYSAEYTRVMSRGAADAIKLADLKKTRDAVYTWLNGIGKFFASGYDAVSKTAGEAFDYLKARFGLGDIGIVPVIYVLVGVGAAIAALTVITINLTDAAKTYAKLKALQDAEARGATPAQAAAMVSQAFGTEANIFGFPLKWLVIGGALLLLAPMISTMGRRNV